MAPRRRKENSARASASSADALLTDAPPRPHTLKQLNQSPTESDFTQNMLRLAAVLAYHGEVSGGLTTWSGGKHLCA